MIDLNNVSLVIATYNEEESIEFVLNELNSYEFFEIIVIDNNSSDKTLEIANKFNNFHIVFNSYDQTNGFCALSYAKHTENIGLIFTTSTYEFNNMIAI